MLVNISNFRQFRERVCLPIASPARIGSTWEYMACPVATPRMSIGQSSSSEIGYEFVMIPNEFEDRNITIIGLGYVGLTLAVTMANSGFRVHGVETNQSVLDSLAKGRAHFWEVGLDSILSEQIASGNLTFGSEIDGSFVSKVYIVTVGTPISNDKITQSQSLINVANSIAAVLNPSDVVILRSTVRVGTTRNIVAPILAQRGFDFDLAFCPERTLEGKALHELSTLPQIVGGINYRSTFRASQIFSFLTPSVVRVHDPETAEMVKLVNNTQRDYMFAFANEVAAMCDALGISAAEVIGSGNLGYPRAGMPMPGPVGGPCLEKDPYIMAEGLADFGYVPTLSIAARQWNESLPDRVVHKIAEWFGSDRPRRIAVAGLAFKGRPATDDLRGTLAAPLITMLKAHFPDAAIIGWDAVGGPQSAVALGVEPAASLEDAFAGADAVIIQNNHEAFEFADIPALSAGMSENGMIYDLWNLHDPRKLTLATGRTYHALGAFGLYAAIDKGLK